LHGLHHVDGVTGLELRYQYLITELLSRPWPERIRFLKLVNVKYIISRQSLDEHNDLLDHVERINPLVFRIKNPLPRAWMVAQVLPLHKGSVEELLKPSFDPWSQVIAGGVLPKLSEPGFFNEVDALRYEQDGRIRITVTADRPSVLVLSESSYPGWRVFVNGQEKECLWLNLLFQGVELPSGRNEILFEFRPQRFSGYAAVSLVSLAFLWIVFFSSFSWTKRRPMHP
ncbi:MAG: YfhO family protein, partial [Deltaproteobacteria bacterium]|nr:YfhO family protein [Deltaproteobacteria bacterium]